MVELKNKADVLVAKAIKFSATRTRNIEIPQHDLAAVRRFQATEQVKQRRFARTRRAHDRQHLSGRDLERNAAQHFNLRTRRAAESFTEITHQEAAEAIFDF
jgi:hypothetical protein